MNTHQMSHRAAVWKNILLGDEYKITCLRNHYYNCVKKYPRLCPEKIKSLIKRDIPRTYSTSSFYKQQHNRNKLKHCFVSLRSFIPRITIFKALIMSCQHYITCIIIAIQNTRCRYMVVFL